MYTKYSEKIYNLFGTIYTIIGIIDVLVLFPVLNDFLRFIGIAIFVWLTSAIVIINLIIKRLSLDMMNELIILHTKNNNRTNNIEKNDIQEAPSLLEMKLEKGNLKSENSDKE